MRRRLPWIIFVGLALVIAIGSKAAADYDWPPDEDGIMPIPLLRKPKLVPRRPGPIPVEPLMLEEIAWRFEFRWLGTAPSEQQLESALRAAATARLPGFSMQPRPARSWIRKLRQAPLVSAPGFEFAHVIWPVTPDLSPYETASTDLAHPLASGRWERGQENLHLDRRELVVDFHLTGPDLLSQLAKVDAFVVAFAESTGARIKSDERVRHATLDDFRARRLQRWSNGIPLAASYLALSDTDRGRRGRVLMAEGAWGLALPELFLFVPDGALSPNGRHLLIAAVAQRLVENRLPDAPGMIDVDVRALKHPEMAEWVTVALSPGASGKIRLLAKELNVRGGRAIALQPDGDAARALCAFSGCELSASFGE